MVRTRRNLSRVRKAAQTQRALDRFLRVRNRSSEEGKGTPVQATDCAAGIEDIHGQAKDLLRLGALGELGF